MKKLRRPASIIIVLFVVLLGALIIRHEYRDHLRTRGLSSDTISAITLHPNGDWPIIKLESPREVSAFVEWLDATFDTSEMRSAPPPIVFDGEILFKDGSVEVFRTSAILDPLTDTSGMDGHAREELNLYTPRGDVLIEWPDRNFKRSGERQPLADIVGSRHAEGLTPEMVD